MSLFPDDRDSANSLLQTVTVPLLNRDRCASLMHHDRLADWILCAGHEKRIKDACQCDHGGPLACRVDGAWVLDGLASHYVGDECGASASPPLFVRISQLRVWIKETITGKWKER